ncbi:MAG: hypothetical protein Kow00114_15490 [Kiloniellaceae bacterium]
MEGGSAEAQAQTHVQKMQDSEPLHAMLLAARSLASCAAAQDAQGEAARSTARSTRALMKLMEGWCIDHAVRSRHAALDGLAREDRGDDTVLAALYRHFGLGAAAPLPRAPLRAPLLRDVGL